MPTDIVPVTGVRITPQVHVFFALGETFQLSAVVSPGNATDRSITWESTDTTVAAVDTVGLVTAKGVGSGVFVTAFTHDGGYESSANVSVDP